VVEIVPFIVHDLIELMRGDLTEFTLKKSDEIARQRGEFYLSRGPCFTAREDGKVVGAGGLLIMWPGVGEGWMLANKDAALRHKKYAYEVVIEHILKLACELNLRRIQAHVDVNVPAAVKFAEQLGFQREGLMRKYGEDGSDHYLYAIVR
jgi:RimJ/RimL family protein N-acetyltransferase